MKASQIYMTVHVHVINMFEASSGVDDGDIYMQKVLELTG